MTGKKSSVIKKYWKFHKRHKTKKFWTVLKDEYRLLSLYDPYIFQIVFLDNNGCLESRFYADSI